MPQRPSLILLLVLLSLVPVSQATAASRVIPGTSIEGILGEIDARQQKIETLQADFRQEKSMALLAETEVATGTFLFSKPNRVRWNYTAPRAVTMLISDGWMTTYYPSLKKAERLEVRQFEDRIFRYLGAASGAVRELGRYFDLRLVDARDQPHYVLELTPKTKTLARRVRSIEIWIDRESYLTTRVEYVEGNGDLTRYEFSNIRTNELIAESRFVLDLPAGVQVEQIRTNR